MRRFITAILLLSMMAATGPGCLIIGGTLVYLVAKNTANEQGLELKDGWLEQTLPYSLDVVGTAAEQVLTVNALPVIAEETRDDGRNIESRYGDGRDVRIELSEPTPDSTFVRIRVGPEGDLGRSFHLLETITEFCEPSE